MFGMNSFMHRNDVLSNCLSRQNARGATEYIDTWMFPTPNPRKDDLILKQTMKRPFAFFKSIFSWLLIVIFVASTVSLLYLALKWLAAERIGAEPLSKTSVLEIAPGIRAQVSHPQQLRYGSENALGEELVLWIGGDVLTETVDYRVSVEHAGNVLVRDLDDQALAEPVDLSVSPGRAGQMHFYVRAMPEAGDWPAAITLSFSITSPSLAQTSRVALSLPVESEQAARERLFWVGLMGYVAAPETLIGVFAVLIAVLTAIATTQAERKTRLTERRLEQMKKIEDRLSEKNLFDVIVDVCDLDEQANEDGWDSVAYQELRRVKKELALRLEQPNALDFAFSDPKDTTKLIKWLRMMSDLANAVDRENYKALSLAIGKEEAKPESFRALSALLTHQTSDPSESEFGRSMLGRLMKTAGIEQGAEPISNDYVLRRVLSEIDPQNAKAWKVERSSYVPDAALNLETFADASIPLCQWLINRGFQFNPFVLNADKDAAIKQTLEPISSQVSDLNDGVTYARHFFDARAIAIYYEKYLSDLQLSAMVVDWFWNFDDKSQQPQNVQEMYWLLCSRVASAWISVLARDLTSFSKLDLDNQQRLAEMLMWKSGFDTNTEEKPLQILRSVYSNLASLPDGSLLEKALERVMPERIASPNINQCAEWLRVCPNGFTRILVLVTTPFSDPSRAFAECISTLLLHNRLLKNDSLSIKAILPKSYEQRIAIPYGIQAKELVFETEKLKEVLNKRLEYCSRDDSSNNVNVHHFGELFEKPDAAESMFAQDLVIASQHSIGGMIEICRRLAEKHVETKGATEYHIAESTFREIVPESR